MALQARMAKMAFTAQKVHSASLVNLVNQVMLATTSNQSSRCT